MEEDNLKTAKDCQSCLCERVICLQEEECLQDYFECMNDYLDGNMQV